METRGHKGVATYHRQSLVDVPKPSDGVGNALRAAFRGRLNHMPPEMTDLLDKLN